MDAQAIKVKLVTQILPVLESLLPNGKIKGREYWVGSIEGEAGNSLHIQIDGDKAGLWYDYATREGGDIYALWMQHKGISFMDVLDEARKYLGITQVKRIIDTRPKGFGVNYGTGMTGTAVLQYLNNVRGINNQTLIKYKVRCHPNHSEPAYAFRYWTPDKKDAFVKYCSLSRDESGKKKIWSTPPFATLWGWWTVTPHDRHVIITEGEIDAMSLSQMEPLIPVLSVPSGTSNMNWIDNDFDYLDQFETIYVVTDNDDAGDKCAEEISKRLGQARVMRVPVPDRYNDVNAAFLSGDENLIDWNYWMKSAFYYTPETIRRPMSYVKEAHRILDKAKEDRKHDSFMFPHIEFEFRDGETTIVSGEPGHGKSDWLYQAHIYEMINDRKVMICSLEIPPAKMLTILVQQKVGTEPSHDQVDEVCEWLDDRMVYHSGQSPKGPDAHLTWEELLSDMEYAYRRFGITRFIIDSLHFLVLKDDYEKQDKLTRELQQFDLNHNVHTSLVAHSNLKGRREGSIPGRHDVEGSGGMIKPIDNGMTIWRNEEKTERVQDPYKFETTKEKAEELHDGIMKVWKQRENGEHFTIKMWFDKESRTFRTQHYGMRHFFANPPKKTDKQEEEPLKDGEF